MADATIRCSTLDPHEEESQIFPNLPDVGLQCLARLPRSCYRPLSRVCKLWQSQLRSQTLYSTRKALKVIDFSLCLQIRVCVNRVCYTHKWYELFPGSNSTAARKMFKIPSQPPSAQPLFGASVVSVGAKIYVIGGGVEGGGSTRTRTVWVYDLVSDQWKLAESQMGVARLSALTAVVNNKIYVMSGCRDDRHPNWAEVFDPETEAWSTLPYPKFDEAAGWNWDDLVPSCSVLDGKIIYSAMDIMDDAPQVTLQFDPSSGEWSHLPSEGYFRYLGWKVIPPAVIDGVPYSFSDGKIRGYDFDANEWKVLRGVMDDDVFPKPINVVEMVNMNGRFVIFWKELCTVTEIKILKFHAAVIEVLKDDTYTKPRRGLILWTGIVGEAPPGTYIVDCLAVGL